MRHCWGTMTMPHTRSGHDQDRSRNMRTRNRRLGPLVQHPPPPPPGRHHTTTSRKSTHNNTKGSGLNKLPQNPGLDTPAKGHCTRYVALHPLRRAAPVTSRCTRYVALHPNRRGAMPTDRVQCLHIGCTTPRHKLRCGPARMEVDGSARLGCTRQRTPTSNRTQQRHTPNNQQDPAATHPQQPTGPEGGRARPAFETTSRAGGSRRSRGIKPGPGARAASSPGASLPRHQARARRSRGVEARARGTHATSPGTTRAYDEAGTRRAKQRGGPRPRQQVRPGDPP